VIQVKLMHYVVVWDTVCVRGHGLLVAVGVMGTEVLLVRIAIGGWGI